MQNDNNCIRYRRTADVLEVALRVLDQVCRDGEPEHAAAALEPVLQDERRDRAALADARAVAEEEARAGAVRERGGAGKHLRRARDRLHLRVGDRAAARRGEELRVQLRARAERRRGRRGERARLDEEVWVRVEARVARARRRGDVVAVLFQLLLLGRLGRLRGAALGGGGALGAPRGAALGAALLGGGQLRGGARARGRRRRAAAEHLRDERGQRLRLRRRRGGGRRGEVVEGGRGRGGRVLQGGRPARVHLRGPSGQRARLARC